MSINFLLYSYKYSDMFECYIKLLLNNVITKMLLKILIYNRKNHIVVRIRQPEKDVKFSDIFYRQILNKFSK